MRTNHSRRPISHIAYIGEDNTGHDSIGQRFTGASAAAAAAAAAAASASASAASDFTYHHALQQHPPGRVNTSRVTLALFDDYKKSLPVPPPGPAPKKTDWSSEWYLGFRKYIKSLLRFLLYGPGGYDVIESMTSLIKTATELSNMDIWLTAFTHKTWGGIRSYETYETLGDVVSKYAFKRYIYLKNPKVRDDVMTNLSNFYMSKHYQPYMAVEFGMDKWIRHGMPPNFSAVLCEDVFEAFCGALDEVCLRVKETAYEEKKFSLAINTMSGVAVVRLMYFFFESHGINDRHQEASAETILREYVKNKGQPTQYSIDGTLVDEIGNLIGDDLKKGFVEGAKNILVKGYRSDDESVPNTQAEGIYQLLRSIGRGVAWKNETLVPDVIKELLSSKGAVDQKRHKISFGKNDVHFIMLTFPNGERKMYGKPVEVSKGQSLNFEELVRMAGN